MRCVEPASELLFDLFPGRFLVGCAVNRPHLRHRPWSLNNFQQYIALLNILTTSTNWVSHFWLEIWMMWTLSSLLLERCVLWGERGWRPIVRKEFLLNSTAERIRTPASLLAKPSAVALVVGPFIHFARTISRNVCWRHCKWVETVAGWAQFRIKRDADKCKKRKECKNWRIKNAKREPGFFLFFFLATRERNINRTAVARRGQETIFDRSQSSTMSVINGRSIKRLIKESSDLGFIRLPSRRSARALRPAQD